MVIAISGMVLQKQYIRSAIFTVVFLVELLILKGVDPKTLVWNFPRSLGSPQKGAEKTN